MKLKRAEVYELIDEERSYQDTLGEARTDGSEKSVGDYITMLSYYLSQAQKTWTVHPGNEHALAQIRKIGAIAVRCLEDHGAPSRNGFIERDPVRGPGSDSNDAGK